MGNCDSYDYTTRWAYQLPQCATEGGTCTTGCSGGDVCYGTGFSWHCKEYGPYETVPCTNDEFCNPDAFATKRCTLNQDEVSDFDGLTFEYTDKWCSKIAWSGSYDCVWDCALAAKKSGKCGSSSLIVWAEPESSAKYNGEQWGCACCKYDSDIRDGGNGFDIYQYSSSFTGQSLRIVDGPRGYDEPAAKPVEFVVLLVVLGLSLFGLVGMCARKCFKKKAVYKKVEVDTDMETADEISKEDEDDKLL